MARLARVVAWRVSCRAARTMAGLAGSGPRPDALVIAAASSLRRDIPFHPVPSAQPGRIPSNLAVPAAVSLWPRQAVLPLSATASR
jgi:hypothetical protein